MTKTTTTFSTLALALTLALTGCGDKKKEAEGAQAKATDTGGAAKAAEPKKPSGALAEIQTILDGAKTKDDIDKAFDKCMGAAIDMGLNGVAEPDKDPAYRAACKTGLAKKRAAIVIADSTPDKMNVMCLSASMQLEELGNEGGAEAEEMKKLLADVNKACGL